MTDPRIHQRCGKPMTPGVFGHTDPNLQYRSQPIWQCRPCGAWEPREGWEGPLPEGWDGTAWR